MHIIIVHVIIMHIMHIIIVHVIIVHKLHIVIVHVIMHNYAYYYYCA